MSKDAPKKPPRPKPEPVIVKMFPDGAFTVHGENIVVHVVAIPDCPGSEILAEDTAELLVPKRVRYLFADGYVKAMGICRPMKPSALLAARQTAKLIHGLNRLKGGGRR